MSDVTDHRITAAFVANGADLLAYFERRVAVREDAADLLGELMVLAWRKARRLPDDPEGARMWLFTSARNLLLNHGRGQRRGLAASERLRSVIATATPAQQAIDEQLDARRALLSLEPHVAELIRLIHWEQFTIADAAALLGISASTARGQYMRARVALAGVLLDGAGAHPAVSREH